MIVSRTDRDSGSTASSLQSSENHELCIVCRETQCNIGNNINNERANKDYTSPDHIRKGTPKARSKALDNHIHGNAQRGQGHGDVEVLTNKRLDMNVPSGCR